MVVFGKPGEAVARYVTKGRQALVEGRVEVSDSSRFNVVADRVRLGAPAGESQPAAARPTKKSKETK